jgi:hypothetical protein
MQEGNPRKNFRIFGLRAKIWNPDIPNMKVVF